MEVLRPYQSFPAKQRSKHDFSCDRLKPQLSTREVEIVWHTQSTGPKFVQRIACQGMLVIFFGHVNLSDKVLGVIAAMDEMEHFNHSF